MGFAYKWRFREIVARIVANWPRRRPAPGAPEGSPREGKWFAQDFGHPSFCTDHFANQWQTILQINCKLRTLSRGVAAAPPRGEPGRLPLRQQIAFHFSFQPP